MKEATAHNSIRQCVPEGQWKGKLYKAPKFLTY
jgi:hypothetical protein